MSDSQAYEELTVAAHGVSVVKRFEADEFPVPAIAFEFRSERDETVAVTLSDTVPESIAVEDLGFHPEYGSEHWIIDDDDSIVFERELGPDESYITVYGIRATGSDNVEQFLTEPSLESVEPPLADSEGGMDIIPESDDDVVKQAIAGDGEIPGLEDPDADADDDVETLDLADPTEPEDASEDEDEDGAAPTETTVAVTDESLVASMAAELRQQEVSGEDVKLLRRAFEIAAEDGGTTAAKIERMYADVADLRAYIGALEEFLDENGTAQQLLGEVEGQIDTFEQELESLRSELRTNAEQLGELEENVQGYDDEIDAISQEVAEATDELDEMATAVDTVTETVEQATDRMGELAAAVEETSAEVADVSGDVEAVNEEVDHVTDRIDELDDEVGSVSTGMDELAEEVESVAAGMDEFASLETVDELDEELESLGAAVEGVEADIEELRETAPGEDVTEQLTEVETTVEELQSWQKQIKETFGG